MSENDLPLLLRALRGLPTPRRPVWLMRQAGRYLPVYQSVRARLEFMELCRDPAASLEVSMEPVDRFGVDGAIVFSDILIPLEAMGLTVTFDDRGPEIPGPLRTAADVDRLAAFDPRERTPWILETLTGLRAAVPKSTAVLGFAGAPFTLAAYAVEGRITKNLVHVMGMRWRDPGLFAHLLGVLAESTIPYLAEQARAGAQALQLFDTWAGQLSREDWRRFALPPIRRIFDGVRETLGDACPPLVLYTRGTSGWLPVVAETGADAYSVDWSLPLGEAKDLVGGRPVQGNLDPTALHGAADEVRRATREMLATVEGRDGVVANLGHGVLVGTPPDNVKAFVDTVQNP